MENFSIQDDGVKMDVDGQLYLGENGTKNFQPSHTIETSQSHSEPTLPEYVMIYVTIFNAIIFIAGVVGNVLVIVVMAKVRDMRTTINLYLVNLSVADLLVLLVCQPIALQSFYLKERWYLGPFMCRTVPVLEHSVLHASTLTIMVISCERYHAICRPLRTFLVFRRPRPCLVALLIWSIALMTAVPLYTMSIHQEMAGDMFCLMPMTERWQRTYTCIMFGLFYALPLILLTAMYGQIMRQMYRHRDLSSHVHGETSNSTGYNLRSRRQVIRMLIAIVILFFLSLAPLRVMILWTMFSSPQAVQDLGIEHYYNILWLCRMFMYVNSAGNPVIYSILSSKFKKAFILFVQGKLNSSVSLLRYNGSTARMSFSTAPTKRMSLLSTTLLGSQREHCHRDRSASAVAERIGLQKVRNSLTST